MRYLGWIALVTLTGFAGACRERPVSPREEGAILAEILDSLFFQPDARFYLIEPQPTDAAPAVAVGEPNTVSSHELLRRALARRHVNVDLVASFVAANGDTSPIAPPPARRLPVVMNTVPPLTDSELVAFLRSVTPPLEGKGFDRYTAAHPGAKQLIEFSHVGQSRDGAHALVYVVQQSGMLRAAGYLVTLRRSGHQWRIDQVENLWTS
jgi:hypothetical protein